MEKNRWWLPFILAIAVCVGLSLGYYVTRNRVFTSGGYDGNRLQKLQDILNLVENNYVDDVNPDKVFEESIVEMLHKLDPHSNYIPASEQQRAAEIIEGKFGGVGMRYFVLRDTVCITHVIKGSPSEKIGIKAGDKILKIDGKNVASVKIESDKVMTMLKGKEGTRVKVELVRQKKKMTFEIIRGTIPIESVASYYLLGDVGYIKIDQFSVTTAEEFRAAAAELTSKGMKRLIIDVRNNGGGVLGSATEIVDEFLKDGKLILKTIGKKIGTKVYKSTSVGDLENIPLAVLINAGSASASEILAGALQDNDRGIIVGRRSFGKGLVQEDTKLRDGSVIRLTIARYYTPTGRCIQRPYNGKYDQYYMDREGENDAELYKPDSSIFVDSLKFKTPKGKIVYGGGGIMPDIFVPFDSTGSNMYYTALRVSPVFQAFSFDYVENKRGQWKSVDDFIARFNVDDMLLAQFVSYAQREYKIPVVKNSVLQSKKQILRLLKAQIAQQLFDDLGFYKVYNSEDNEFLKALEVLKK
ncbi:MAG: S41 family peptidase [Bacteroidota bacterium]